MFTKGRKERKEDIESIRWLENPGMQDKCNEDSKDGIILTSDLCCSSFVWDGPPSKGWHNKP